MIELTVVHLTVGVLKFKTGLSSNSVGVDAHQYLNKEVHWYMFMWVSNKTVRMVI